MVFGGALGNLADRVRIDGVTDFIDPILWPAFNVADMCIVLGVLGVLYLAESGR
jgi:signal peptidase II